MFARDASTGIDTGFHDLTHRFVHARGFVRVVGIVWNVRMKISVASVEDIANCDTILGCNRGDLLEHFSELRPWNHRVLNDEMRRHSSHRSECLLPALPKPRSLSLVAGDFH